MFDKITKFAKDHKKELIISGLVVVAGAVVYNMNKKTEDSEKKEKDYSKSPIIATALESQPQDWMLIISRKDKLGNDTDFAEVGRQIRNAEFEKED